MKELITEIAIYLGIAALLGLLLGYLVWGWRWRARLAAARADGIASVRTSMDGDSALLEQLGARTRERDQLKHRVEQLTARLAARPAAPAAGHSRRRDAEPEPEQHQAARQQAIDRPGDPATGTSEGASGESATVGPVAESADDGDIVSIFGDDAAPEATRTGGHPRPEVAKPALAESGTSHGSDGLARLQLLLSDRPAEADDLQQIEGIGAVMERTLNRLGFRHYDQIAALSVGDIARLSESIGIPSARIIRQRWVEQARALRAERHDPAQGGDTGSTNAD